MSVPILILSGLVVLATHALEAVTGFGCTVLALPFVTALLGLKTGVMVLTILAWLLALYISMVKRRDIDLRQFGIILGFVLPGLPLGMYLFRNIQAGPLKRVLAVFIIVASTVQLLKPVLSRRGRARAEAASPVESAVRGSASGRRAADWPYYVLLAAGGVIHGMFSSGGPFVVLYASRAFPDKGAFRATLTLLWSTLNTVLIALYIAEGAITSEVALSTAAMLPFLAVGIVVGERLHSKASPAAFSAIVFAMLLASGIVLLVSGG